MVLRSGEILSRAQGKCGGICRCGGRQKNICKIKGLNYCTEFSKFHMALRHIIVLLGNKEALSFQGWKTTLTILIIKSECPNGPSGQGLWHSLHWPWSELTVWPNNGNIDFTAQKNLVELSKLTGKEGEYHFSVILMRARRSLFTQHQRVSTTVIHPRSSVPFLIHLWYDLILQTGLASKIMHIFSHTSSEKKCYFLPLTVAILPCCYGA